MPQKTLSTNLIKIKINSDEIDVIPAVIRVMIIVVLAIVESCGRAVRRSTVTILGGTSHP